MDHEPCPWCGSTSTAGYYRPESKPKVHRSAQRLGSWKRFNRMKPYVVAVPDARPIRKNKHRFTKPVSGGKGYVLRPEGEHTRYRSWVSSTWMRCAHPIHDMVVEKPQPIPPKAHNPDLTEQKKWLKRQLQGKERR